jgi:hypothetical protein
VADEGGGQMDRAVEPYAWQQVAREYALAGNYLLDWYDVTRISPNASAFEFTHSGGVAPPMVLFAIAVENLLKAIRVAREGSPVLGGELSRHFKHHNLLNHAERAKVSVSAEERDLLEHLTDLIEAGRYPVPVAEGKTPRAWHFNFPRDVELVWCLLERLDTELRQTGAPTLPETNFRERPRPPGYALP